MLSNIVFLMVIGVSSCEKILCIFPVLSAGHAGFHRSIYNHLSLKGHEITVLTYAADNTIKSANVTEIEIPNLTEITIRNDHKIKQMQMFNNPKYDVLKTLSWAMEYFDELIEGVMIYIETIFPGRDTHFDLLLVDSWYPSIFSLGCRFKVPVIGLSSSFLWPYTYSDLGIPVHPLISFDILQNLDDTISLYDKLERVYILSAFEILYEWFKMPEVDKTIKKYFGSNCPHLKDLRKNVSLLLVNTNPVFHNVHLKVPSMVEIGGLIHVHQKRPLPEDIQVFLDESPQGVIYFSLGSSLKYSHLPETTTNIIRQTLSELPYNVLWKWDHDDLPNKTKNIMTKKWLPQQDLLGHKNIKVYVTHGGLQSIEEAMANCVPMVGIPCHADQFRNVVQLMKLGVAQGIDHTTMTKDSLKKAIIEVAENNKYKEKIRKVKKFIQDQPTHGLDKAVWWIEYTLRHKQWKHLKNASGDMSWSEYLLLDVAAISGVTICIISYVFICVIQMLQKS